MSISNILGQKSAPGKFAENTYAGSVIGYDGDNHLLLSTEFNISGSTVFDSAGNAIFDDTGNGRLRKGSGGIVNTVAGGYLGDGAKATSAALVLPEALPPRH